MPSLIMKSPNSVLKAIQEFDDIGRDVFLEKYKFGKAREYFLFLNGKYYDSKAICGAAYGYEHPQNGPLGAGDFSGGEKTVQAVLEKLGFTVVRGRPNATSDTSLVLAENEVTFAGQYDFWKDDTGVQYQYPNAYRNLIQPGRRFIYYRGVRRAKGRRGQAEYFGRGVIGDVWRDPAIPEDTPKGKWRWYCSIEDYQPFAQPVPAKQNNKYFENMTSSIQWRTGVRKISHETFAAILSATGIAQATPLLLLQYKQQSNRRQRWRLESY